MNSRRGRWWIAAALVAGAWSAGCNRQPPPPPPSMTPEVAVVKIEPRRLLLTTELPGRTAGYLVAEIRPQVNGLLQKRFFTEGANVKAGDLLYQIDPAPYQAALDSANASLLAATETADRAEASLQASMATVKRHESILTLAKTNFRRYDSLVKTQAASAMQRDEAASAVEVAESALRVAQTQVDIDREAVSVARAAIKQAEALVQTARINLAYTKIIAPISGRIGRSMVTEGAIVTAYQPTPLSTIQQFDPIYVDVPQSTAELNRLRRRLASGQLTNVGTDRVKILLLEDGTEYPREGSLRFRDVTVDPTTGSVIIRIVVPNPDGVLLPGMGVRAVVDQGVTDHAILVPQQAVSRDPKGNPIALVVNNKNEVEQRNLVTDRAIGSDWLVTSGLAEGDRVIVEGMQKVQQMQAMMRLKAKDAKVVVKAVPFGAEKPPAAKPQSVAQVPSD